MSEFHETTNEDKGKGIKVTRAVHVTLKTPRYWAIGRIIKKSSQLTINKHFFVYILLWFVVSVYNPLDWKCIIHQLHGSTCKMDKYILCSKFQDKGVYTEVSNLHFFLTVFKFYINKLSYMFYQTQGSIPFILHYF